MFNLTLFIQGFNFLLAYWLLARFFFKPVLNQIEQQTKEKRALSVSIKHNHELLSDLALKKQNLWTNTCSEFSKYANFGQAIYHKPKAHNPNILSIDLQAEIDPVERDLLTKVLVDKIMSIQ